MIVLSLPRTAQAAAGINQQINFQGRLFNAQGATVADGYYNIQFKIYQDGDGQSVDNTTGSPAGSLKWTENHLNANSQGVQVKNGFLSVQLGSITAFGSSIDWNQDTLWLSMNIAGTNGSCTPFSSCSPDGEMVPMKRLSAVPYALNSQSLGGLTSTQFVQLAQGLQTDASTGVNSIAINKTGTGNLVQLQSGGADAFVLNNTGDLQFGANVDHTLSVATAGADTAGKDLAIAAGTAGSSAGALAGGSLSIDAGQGSGGGGDGDILIGSIRGATIQIGNTALSSGTQAVNIGTNNTSGGTTNVTIGSGASATGGTTAIQAKGNVTITTNGVARGTFNTSGYLYLGNGVSAPSPASFVVSGTASSASGTAGGTLTVQGGNATAGDANGGALMLSGGTGIGTGAKGLVVLSSTSIATVTNDPNCYTGGALVSTSCTIAQASLDGSSAIIIGFSEDDQTATLPSPTITTVGRIVYITAADGSSDFILSVNGGGTGNIVAMRENTSATMIWNGTARTAAGASSSTTLQSAYDNTLQSAGGAELVVSQTSNTSGLTIRDSSIYPVNGTLLSVQSSSAAGLLSVNSSVAEYSSDSGAEVAGATASSFPASTWGTIGSSTVTRYTTAGDYIATGKASVSVATTTAANDGTKNTLTTALTGNMNYNVSFATRLLSGTFTDLSVYYSVDGSAASVACASNKIVPTSVWTKINCTFAAPAAGITSGNAILIRQTGSGTARTFFIDNLSVTIAADFNYATDGSVFDGTNFTTNWTAVASSTVTRSTTIGQDASDSAQVVTTGANQGVRNKLKINPLTDTLYRVSVYASSTTSGFDNFTVRYSRDGGTNFVDCKDYNTQSVSGTAAVLTQVTCFITTDGTAATNPYVYFTQTDGTGRTFYVDVFSITLYTNTAPNVQIGGGANGGPVALFTLDRAAAAPIASNNDALLGSMYYDTSLGKLQCYEADGWGACGSSPDNIVTISPEYTNAVLHGTGIGTMTSDICSDTLNINDGSSGQATICGTNETYNYYQWTSPQATTQTYSIFVTYQLPNTFKSFLSGQTSLMGRTDSSNATVSYQIYRQDTSSGLVACGSAVTVSTGSVSSWQTGVATGAADPSTCGFSASGSIVFKIDVQTKSSAKAYVGNLNFAFNNN